MMEKKLRNAFRQIEGIDLFKDALACKIRDEFRALISLGISVQKVEDILINFFENAEGEMCDRGVCYLALAITEWNAGRLTERLKQKALDVLDSSVILAPWKEACSVPKEKRGNLFDLIVKDNNDPDHIFDPFYIGFAFEENEYERTLQRNKILKNIIHLAADIPFYQDINVNFSSFEYSENAAHIFALDKTEEKKLALKIDNLKKMRCLLLSPLPKEKKYSKPYFGNICNDFYPGDIIILQVPEGEFRGYWFAFQFLAKKKKDYFMSTENLGISYENYGSFFDYFSLQKPTIKTLNKRGFKALQIRKKDNKYYFTFALRFFYDKKTLEQYLVEKHYNESYLTLHQLKEAEYYLKLSGSRPSAFELGVSDLNNIFLCEPHFFNLDQNADKAEKKDESNFN